MYEKDKKQRITLRLSDKQFGFVAKQCDLLGITPSDYIRMLVNSVLFTTEQSNRLQNVDAKEYASQVLEGLGRENDKAIKHD